MHVKGLLDRYLRDTHRLIFGEVDRKLVRVLPRARRHCTRATAIRARTKALQLLRHHIISAPEELRDQVRNLTRMQLIRTCAAWRPDTLGYRDPVVATRISLKSLAGRILDLNDEIADLDASSNPWSVSSHRNCSPSAASASRPPGSCW
jgi:hypothetical protein